MASESIDHPAGAAPVLREQRWWPEADQLAASFGVADLPGVFNKTLRIPPGMRAYIVQAGQATEVGQGEYELEGFFTRLNQLLRSAGGMVLVARTTPLALCFSPAGVRSCEGLALQVQVQLSVKLEQVALFARHFMATAGVIDSSLLQQLLAPALDQLTREFLGSQALREMAANGNLRPQFEERLHSGMQQRLAQFGLAISSVDTLQLQHAGLDLRLQQLAERVAMAGQLDRLYDADTWRRIDKEAQAARARLRRTELALEQGEQVQGLRLRAVELYGRVAAARNRKLALEAGAAEEVRELEQTLAEKAAGRVREQDQWEHVRTLARIRQRTELELAKREGSLAIARAQQEIQQQLQARQLSFRLEQAQQIDAAARGRALEEGEHAQLLALRRQEHAARLAEAARLADWEASLSTGRLQALQQEQALQAEQRREQLAQVSQRIAARADEAQHAKLRRTLEAEAQFNANQRELERARWQDGHDSLLARQAHEADMARIEIERVAALGAIEAARLEAMGKLGVAPLRKPEHEE